MRISFLMKNVFALLLGLLTALNASGQSENGAAPPARDYSFTISTTQPWTDTGVDCKAGEALEIAATGSVYHSNKNKRGTSVGPDGDPDPSRRRANVPGLPDADHSALIGSIARQQPYFVVGRSTVYACPGDGRLFLGINDRDVSNNGGQFSATIKR